MYVLFTEPAKESLKEICKHYRSLELSSYAIKVRKTILGKAKSLSDNPERGQKEEMLKSLDQGQERDDAIKGHLIFYDFAASINDLWIRW